VIKDNGIDAAEQAADGRLQLVAVPARQMSDVLACLTGLADRTAKAVREALPGTSQQVWLIPARMPAWRRPSVAGQPVRGTAEVAAVVESVTSAAASAAALAAKVHWWHRARVVPAALTAADVDSLWFVALVHELAASRLRAATLPVHDASATPAERDALLLVDVITTSVLSAGPGGSRQPAVACWLLTDHAGALLGAGTVAVER
jgi:hypothetical protein